MLRRSVRSNADVSARASLDGKKLCVMVWHYHDEDVPGPDAAVDVTLENLPLSNGQAKLEHFQVDGEHSNAETAWQKMGSPKTRRRSSTRNWKKSASLPKLSPPKTLRSRTARRS